MAPVITKRPPSVRIISVARLVREHDDRNQAGEQPQDARLMSRASVLAARNFVVLVLLRVEQPDQRGAEDALVDDLVQPVDRLLRLGEQLADAPEHHLERHADHRQHREHRQPELPVDREQQRRWRR